MNFYKYLVYLSIVTLGLSGMRTIQLPTHDVNTYSIKCQKEAIHYFICGTKRKEMVNPSLQEYVFLSPVGNPQYTALFHSYPDENLAHYGIDIIGDVAIHGATSGQVVETCSIACGGYGKYVVIYHAHVGLYTLYAHLQTIFVRQGDVIYRNDKTQQDTVIGIMGNTGNSQGVHLHFEVRTNQSHDYAYRLDPVAYLQITLAECNDMFGLAFALTSSVHRYQQWYYLDTNQIIRLR